MNYNTPKFECPFCGKVHNMINAGNGSDIVCCGEIGQCVPEGEGVVCYEDLMIIQQGEQMAAAELFANADAVAYGTK